MTQISVEEIKVAAEAAIGARQKAVDAKAAADAAGGEDDSLNTAADTAAQEAATAEATALTLSQNLPATDDVEKKKQKLLRKRAFINKDLKTLGVAVEDDEEGDDEDEDLDKPLTRRDLQAMEASNARRTAQQMVEAISDPLDRAAVLQALPQVVASSDPEKDFRSAVAIANIARNSKILEEIQRKPITRTTRTGTGAPPLHEEPFVPTAYEQMFMQKGLLKKEDILKARAKAIKAS